MSNSARRQPAGPAIAPTFLEEPGVQVGEVYRLEGLKLQPTDDRQCM
jgi:hypothetical protein